MASLRRWSSNPDTEEWQMARKWLLQTHVLPAHHRAFGDDANLFDLAQSLRDGVLLCQVVNHLRPGSIRDMNMKPQMSQFLCMKNIRQFLAACTKFFGIRKEDLFEPNELFDVSDFGKIIHTLSCLSKSSYAVECGLEPFPPTGKNKSYHQDENIYANLEEIAMKRDIADEENPYDAVEIKEEDEGKIYEDLVTVRFKIESAKAAAQKSTHEEKRGYVVQELLETEKNYLDALKMLTEKFINVMKSFLEPKQVRRMFINIEELREMHQEFLKELQRVCTGGQHISRAFLENRDRFLMYGEFCARLPDAQVFIDEVTKGDVKMKDLLNQCQQNANNGKFTLRSMLVIPLQRVLKYPLLLKELNKHTKEGHPDKKSLEVALKAMEDVATFINAVKRDDENMKTVQAIQSSLVENIIEGDLIKLGHLVKDGELQIKLNEDTSPKKRHVFLFDRAMLVCKTKGDSYHHKQTLYLIYFNIDENALSNAKGKFSFGWHMQALTAEAERNDCFMFAKTEDMKRKWVDDIIRTIESLSLKGVETVNHKYELYTFEDPTYCAVCKNLLWGSLNQGYRCIECKDTAHRHCVASSKPCQYHYKPFGVYPPGSSSPIINRPSRNHLTKQISTPTLPNFSPPSVRTPGRKSSAPASMISTGFADRAVVVACATFHGVAPGGRQGLTFVQGDEIEVIKKSDPEWWEGRHVRSGSMGYFPCSHVKSKEDACSPPPRPASRKYKYENSPTPISEDLRPSPDLAATLAPYPWFAALLKRKQAEERLKDEPTGTFLVRESDRFPGTYALTVKYEDKNKHIQIPIDEDGMFYLTQAKVFPSIPELIDYYKKNTLGASFKGVDTNLVKAFNEKGIGWAKVKFSYTAKNPREISIAKNDRILVLNNNGDWWKGELNGHVGFFPSNYISEMEEVKT